MQNEIWKDIHGYEGMYQVSNLGRVKSIDRVVVKSDGTLFRLKSRIMKPYSHTYMYVRLTKDGKNRSYSIHRLVCEAFHPNPNNYPCVNHKDNNPLNNYVGNLEWCTYAYNNNYGTHSQRLSDTMVEKYGVAIDVYTKRGEYIKSYSSIRDAINDGYTRDSISKCCRGELDSHCGLIFKYKGDSFCYKNRKGNVVVKKYNLTGQCIKTYFSINDAARDNGLKKDNLLLIHRGIVQNKRLGGYYYQFYE